MDENYDPLALASHVSAGRRRNGSFSTTPRNSGTITATVAGHLEPGAADWVYLPVQVPEGVAQIDVSYTYSKPAVPPGTLSNSCYIGIFDQRGIRLNGRGFRGWSGGFRTTFSIAADSATPGYLPGPVRPGTWTAVYSDFCPDPIAMTRVSRSASTRASCSTFGVQRRSWTPSPSNHVSHSSHTSNRAWNYSSRR